MSCSRISDSTNDYWHKSSTVKLSDNAPAVQFPHCEDVGALKKRWAPKSSEICGSKPDNFPRLNCRKTDSMLSVCYYFAQSTYRLRISTDAVSGYKSIFANSDLLITEAFIWNVRQNCYIKWFQLTLWLPSAGVRIYFFCNIVLWAGDPDRTLHAKTSRQPAARIEQYMQIDTVSRRAGYTYRPSV